MAVRFASNLARRNAPAAAAAGAAPDHWHISVMLQQTVDAWLGNRVEGGRFIDLTVGGGGHSAELLRRNKTAKVLAIDADPEAILQARKTLEEFADRVTFVNTRFDRCQAALQDAGWPSQVDGILADCGVNSNQLNAAHRGFSFHTDGPLDMRLNQSQATPTAADIVNFASEAQLVKIFRDYGEEPEATVAARAIAHHRTVSGPFKTTSQLADLLEDALDKRNSKRWGRTAPKRPFKHPGTQCFQALRIAVNQELRVLETLMKAVPDMLVQDGRLAMITFHSLESRIVKVALEQQSKDNLMEVISDGVYLPEEEEVQENRRARSAQLRVARRL